MKVKELSCLRLRENERRALQELSQRLLKRFPGVEIFLYGSKARGDDREFSDIDLLILLKDEINTDVEREVIDLAFNVELEYDVVFGLLIESRNFWDSALAKAMPIHWNIDREGIIVV